MYSIIGLKQLLILSTKSPKQHYDNNNTKTIVISNIIDDTKIMKPKKLLPTEILKKIQDNKYYDILKNKKNSYKPCFLKNFKVLIQLTINYIKNNKNITEEIKNLKIVLENKQQIATSNLGLYNNEVGDFNNEVDDFINEVDDFNNEVDDFNNKKLQFLNYEKFLDLCIFTHTDYNSIYALNPYYNNVITEDTYKKCEILFTNEDLNLKYTREVNLTNYLNMFAHSDEESCVKQIVDFILEYLLNLIKNQNRENAKYIIFKFWFSLKEDNVVIIEKLQVILLAIIMYVILQFKHCWLLSTSCIFFVDVIERKSIHLIRNYKPNKNTLDCNYGESFIVENFKKIKSYFLKYLCSRDDQVSIIENNEDYILNGKVFINFNNNDNSQDKFKINLSFPYNILTSDKSLLNSVKTLSDIYAAFRTIDKEMYPLFSPDNNYYSSSKFNNLKLFKFFKFFNQYSNIEETKTFTNNIIHLNVCGTYKKYRSYLNQNFNFENELINIFKNLTIFDNNSNELKNLKNSLIIFSNAKKRNNKYDILPSECDYVSDHEKKTFWETFYGNDPIYINPKTGAVNEYILYTLINNNIYMSYYILNFLTFLSAIGLKYIGTYYELYCPEKYDIYFMIINEDLFFFKFFNIFIDSKENTFTVNGITISSLINSLILFGFKKIAKHLITFLTSVYYFILTLKSIKIGDTNNYVNKKYFLKSEHLNSINYYISCKLKDNTVVSITKNNSLKGLKNYINGVKIGPDNAREISIEISKYLNIDNDYIIIKKIPNIAIEYSSKYDCKLLGDTNYELIGTNDEKTDSNLVYINFIDYILKDNCSNVFGKVEKALTDIKKSIINNLKFTDYNDEFNNNKNDPNTTYINYIKVFNTLIYIHNTSQENKSLSKKFRLKNSFNNLELFINIKDKDIVMYIIYMAKQNNKKIINITDNYLDVDKFVTGFFEIIFKSVSDKIYNLLIYINVESNNSHCIGKDCLICNIKVLVFMGLLCVIRKFRYSYLLNIRRIFYLCDFINDDNIIYAHNSDSHNIYTAIYECYINYITPSKYTENNFKINKEYTIINGYLNITTNKNTNFRIKIQSHYLDLLNKLNVNKSNNKYYKILNNKYESLLEMFRFNENANLFLSSSQIDSVIIDLHNIILSKTNKLDNIFNQQVEDKTLQNRTFLGENSFKASREYYEGVEGPSLYILLRNWYSKYFDEVTNNSNKKNPSIVFFSNIYFFFMQDKPESSFKCHSDIFYIHEFITKLFSEKGFIEYIDSVNEYTYHSNHTIFDKLEQGHNFIQFMLVNQKDSGFNSESLPFNMIQNLKDRYNVLYLLNNNLVFLFKYIQGVIIFLQFLGINFIGSLYDFFYPKKNIIYFTIIDCKYAVYRIVNISSTHNCLRFTRFKESLYTFGFKKIAKHIMSFIVSFIMLLFFMTNNYNVQINITSDSVFNYWIALPEIKINTTYTAVSNPVTLYNMFVENINTFYDVKNWKKEGLKSRLEPKINETQIFVNVENALF